MTQVLAGFCDSQDVSWDLLYHPTGDIHFAYQWVSDDGRESPYFTFGSEGLAQAVAWGEERSQ